MLQVPGAVAYGFAYFFLKLSVYSLLLWLPLFLGEELKFDTARITSIAMANEVGTISGGIILGFLSDQCYSRRSPLTALVIIIGTIIMVFLTVNHKTMCSTLIFFSIGLLLGGINHIISVTCACDLGYRKDGKPSRIAGVTGIIDGIGSLGTSIGQIVIGLTAESLGWRDGFLLVLTVVTFCTLLPLWNIIM